jgi:hypothetical protein
VSDYFGSDFLDENGASGSPGDSTVSWGINTGAVLNSSVYQDSLKVEGVYNGLRGFAIRDTHNVAIWARAGTLSQGHTYDIPIAVTVPQPSGGRVIVVTAPLKFSNGFFSASRFLAEIFAQLGLTGP